MIPTHPVRIPASSSGVGSRSRSAPAFTNRTTDPTAPVANSSASGASACTLTSTHPYQEFTLSELTADNFPGRSSGFPQGPRPFSLWPVGIALLGLLLGLAIACAMTGTDLARCRRFSAALAALDSEAALAHAHPKIELHTPRETLRGAAGLRAR